jgi:hypothetical protein
MKTGRLLKFRRAEADVQAFVFREEGRVKATVYLASAAGSVPCHTEDGTSETEVEDRVRAWVDARYPKPR